MGIEAVYTPALVSGGGQSGTNNQMNAAMQQNMMMQQQMGMAGQNMMNPQGGQQNQQQMNSNQQMRSTGSRGKGSGQYDNYSYGGGAPGQGDSRYAGNVKPPRPNQGGNRSVSQSRTACKPKFRHPLSCNQKL